MIIVIDNYDSFTYNLVQYLGELGADLPVASEVQVYRNDQISLADIRRLKPAAVLVVRGALQDAAMLALHEELCRSRRALGRWIPTIHHHAAIHIIPTLRRTFHKALDTM